MAVIAAFYGWIVYAIRRRYEHAGELAHGEVHV
jgi:uncharacterized membrane protein